MYSSGYSCHILIKPEFSKHKLVGGGGQNDKEGPGVFEPRSEPGPSPVRRSGNHRTATYVSDCTNVTVHFLV